MLVIPTLIVIYTITTITFFVMHATPGGPFDTAGDKPLPAATRRNLEKKYGLDKPLWQQYFLYVSNLAKGDLGPSYASRNRQVMDIITEAFPRSAQLGLVAICLSVVIGIGLGILAADYVSMLVATIGISIPSYVTASVLIWIVSIKLDLVPTGGWEGIFSKNIIIPVIALSFFPIAIFARYTRASVLGVLRQGYVRTARAKGVKERLVLFRHVLRNALIPIATVGGVQFVAILTGSFFVETVCYITGVGNLFVRSSTGRDYPMLMALTLMLAMLTIIANLLVDLLYAFPDLLLMIILMTYLKATLPSVESGPLLIFRRSWEWSGGTAGIFLALAITSWLTLSRLVRGETLALKCREFIEAAHCIGATNG